MSAEWQGVPSNDDELREETEGLKESQRLHLRKRALSQVFFMARGVLGHKDVNKDTHGDLCRFLDRRDRDHPLFCDRRMELMPRGHLKSTIATEADSLRIGLEDPDGARILIANEIFGNASSFVAAIMGYCEKNDLLKLLFPDVIPSRTTGPGVKWSATDGATLVRKTSWKEPTWLPIGVGGAAVSKHFSHIKCDDLIGLEAFQHEAELKKAIAWSDQIEGLSIGEFGTIIDWTGTRWSRRDLYRHVMQVYGEDMRVFSRGMYEDQPDGTQQIIFPQHFSWKKIRQLMKKPAIFWAQYMNQPISAELTDFDEGNLRYFHFAANGDVIVRGERWPLEALDVVVLVDPNGGSKMAPDEFAISVVGTTPRNDHCVLLSYGGRPEPDAAIDHLFKVCKRWRPRAVGIEKAGQQNTIYYFKKKCEREQTYFNVEELHHKNVEKQTRIRTALSTPVVEHRLFLLASQGVLKQQIVDFPDIENDDRIDSLAYGPQLWHRPYTMEEQEDNDDAVGMVMRARSKRTGY